MEGMPMNQVLAYLMTEHSPNEIVEALANLCLEQAKRAEKPGALGYVEV